jgi:PST family polysaccharide transporter
MIQLYHHDLFLAGKNKISGLILLSGLGIKILSVYPLTVSYGLNGAALSNLISLCLVLILYSLYSKKFPSQLCNLRFWLAILMMVAVVLIARQFFMVSGRGLELLKLIILSGVGAATFFKVFQMKPRDFLD